MFDSNFEKVLPTLTSIEIANAKEYYTSITRIYFVDVHTYKDLLFFITLIIF